MARRRRGEPHVMAYWLMFARIASQAASLITSGAGKSGKPWARLMAPVSLATRVISRITDSVKPCVRRAVRGEGLGAVMLPVAPSGRNGENVPAAAAAPGRALAPGPAAAT